MALWLVTGVLSWIAFGVLGRSRLFNPFESWDFYVLILPMFLLVAPAGVACAIIVPFLNKD